MYVFKGIFFIRWTIEEYIGTIKSHWQGDELEHKDKSDYKSQDAHFSKMREPVEKMLEIVGVDLNFDNFSIKGIPGFSLTLFHGETISETIDKRDYKIQCSAKDIKNNEIAEGMNLTCTDGLGQYCFQFKVKRDPIIQLTGWASIYVDFLGREAI